MPAAIGRSSSERPVEVAIMRARVKKLAITARGSRPWTLKGDHVCHFVNELVTLNGERHSTIGDCSIVRG
jgi:hypothetical protein